MKLNISKEWMEAAIKREEQYGGDCGCCSPDIAKAARELALAKGHTNPDEEITCVGGAKLPVWQFYIEDVIFLSKD